MAEPTQRPALPLRVLAALASAAALGVVGPTAGWWWLDWFLWVPLLWALREDTPRTNAALAFTYATVGQAVIFRWIVETIGTFSNLPMPVAFLALFLFSVVFGLPYFFIFTPVHWIRRRFGDAWMLALPAWMVVVEWAAMHALLFPFQHGAAQYRVLPIFQVVSITGVLGVSFLIMTANCALAEWLYRRREGRPAPVRALAGVVIAVSLVASWGQWRLSSLEATLAAGPRLRVAQVQSEFQMMERFRRGARQTFFDFYDASAAHAPGSVDLVVWPEGASPYPVTDTRVKPLLVDLARKLDADLVIGSGARENRTYGDQTERMAFNSVYLVRPDGEVPPRYDKMVPLPFGEYRPLARYIPWFWEMVRGPGNFSAGTEAVLLESSHAGALATPICYEAILPYVCRRWTRPDLLVNVTNDAWFGTGSASSLHGMLAAIRSTELGVPMVRSTYTGVSFVVEAHGRIHHETKLFTRYNRAVELRSGTVATVYARFGDWFPLLCALALAAGLGLTRRRG